MKTNQSKYDVRRAIKFVRVSTDYLASQGLQQVQVERITKRLGSLNIDPRGADNFTERFLTRIFAYDLDTHNISSRLGLESDAIRQERLSAGKFELRKNAIKQFLRGN